MGWFVLFLMFPLFRSSSLVCRSFILQRPSKHSSFSATAASTALLRRMASVEHQLTPTSSSVSSSSTAAAAAGVEEVDPGVVAGTTLRVLKYPHPALRAVNAEISADELLKDVGSSNHGRISIAKLAKEMFAVMYAANGVGLAAPQVGVNKRLLVYNASGDKTKWLEEVIMVNPVITEFSTGRDVETEGCLSFPNMTGQVERAKWIKVEALNLKGKKIKKKFTDWEARIFQHEYDHLDGVVYIDRLIEPSKAEVQDRLEELVREFDHGQGEPAI
jgi:peptide deformylase